MFQCVEEISQKVPEILSFSGRNANQLGSYHQCLDHSGMTYNLLSLKSSSVDIDFGTTLGLCLPTSCDQQTVKQVLSSLLIQMKLPFQLINVNSRVQDYEYGYGFLFYITVTITILVSALVILASIFNKRLRGISMFSIQQSRKILKRHANSSLNVLNGVRSISMIWVVLGHAMSFTLSGAINMATVEQNVLLKPFFLFIEAGLFAVDVFFYVGGLLLAYVFVKQAQNNSSKFAYLLAVIQRLLRFWPSYIMAMLIYYTIYLHLGSGPRWASDQQTVNYCSGMWRAIFFIDNFVNKGDTQCMGWGWYLQNDMQLFIISLAFLFIYSIKPWLSKLTILIAVITSCIYTYIWTFNHNITVITHLSDFINWGIFMENIYMMPWARAPPYLYGVLVGLFFVQYWIQDKDKKLGQQRVTLFGKLSIKFKNNRKLRIFTQWTGVALILFIILIPRTLQTGTIWPQSAHSLYQALAKVFFVIGLTLVILPSILGCLQSIIFFAMDTSLFNFIAKISFCTYLIHLTILQAWVQSRAYDRYFTTVPVFTEFCGVLVLSLFSGLLMTFTIQIPFSKLQKKLINTVKSLLKMKAATIQSLQNTKSPTQIGQVLLKPSLLSQN